MNLKDVLLKEKRIKMSPVSINTFFKKDKKHGIGLSPHSCLRLSQSSGTMTRIYTAELCVKTVGVIATICHLPSPTVTVIFTVQNNKHVH